MIAIDGSKFKAVNNRKKNDSQGSMKRRIARVEKHIKDYMQLLDAKDKSEPTTDERDVPELQDKLESLQKHLGKLKQREKTVKAQPDKQISETDPDSRLIEWIRCSSHGRALSEYEVSLGTLATQTFITP